MKAQGSTQKVRDRLQGACRLEAHGSMPRLHITLDDHATILDINQSLKATKKLVVPLEASLKDGTSVHCLVHLGKSGALEIPARVLSSTSETVTLKLALDLPSVSARWEAMIRLLEMENRVRSRLTKQTLDKLGDKAAAMPFSIVREGIDINLKQRGIDVTLTLEVLKKGALDDLVAALGKGCVLLVPPDPCLKKIHEINIVVRAGSNGHKVGFKGRVLDNTFSDDVIEPFGLNPMKRLAIAHLSKALSTAGLRDTQEIHQLETPPETGPTWRALRKHGRVNATNELPPLDKTALETISPVVETLRSQSLKFQAMNHFDRLGVEWTSGTTEVRAQYKSLKKTYEFDRFPEALRPHISKEVHHINEMLDLAFDAISSRKGRQIYRRRVLDRSVLDDAIQDALTKARAAILLAIELDPTFDPTRI